MDITVYYNPELFDCYTAVINGFCFAMSRNPLSPQGVNQWLGIMSKIDPENKALLGEPVELDSLPSEVKKAIEERSEHAGA